MMKGSLIFAAIIACAMAATVPLSYPVPRRDSRNVGRIVLGQPAAPGQFPFQVSVFTTMGGGGVGICGGSIISNTWILTAAHCTPAGSVSAVIHFGSNALQSATNMQSSNLINHPAYNPANLNNDISLIGLPAAIGFSATINSISLPSGHVGNTFAGDRARVSGFGQTVDGGAVSQVLNFVDVNIITNAVCAATYGTSVIVASTICAQGADNVNAGVCSGDSGGPLTWGIAQGSPVVQIGVVSFVSSAGCANAHPSGYVRVTSFLAWIASISGVN